MTMCDNRSCAGLRMSVRHGFRFSCAAALLTIGSALPGCYERVVDASGPNSGNTNVQPGYRSDTWLDRAVFPEKGREESAFGSTTAERQRAYMRQNRGGN